MCPTTLNYFLGAEDQITYVKYDYCACCSEYFPNAELSKWNLDFKCDHLICKNCDSGVCQDYIGSHEPEFFVSDETTGNATLMVERGHLLLEDLNAFLRMLEDLHMNIEFGPQLV